jgi:hypothetical protein
MAWESARIGTPERRHLARMVLRHRLLPADPLAAGHDSDPEAERIFLTA